MADEILNRYRQSIDNIDAALVFMLAERFKITQAVGEYKASTSLPPQIPAGKNGRSSGCGNWPRKLISIPTSPRNSYASSSTKSSATTNESAKADPHKKQPLGRGCKVG